MSSTASNSDRLNQPPPPMSEADRAYMEQLRKQASAMSSTASNSNRLNQPPPLPVRVQHQKPAVAVSDANRAYLEQLRKQAEATLFSETLQVEKVRM